MESVSFELTWPSRIWGSEVSFKILDALGKSVCFEGVNPTTLCGGRSSNYNDALTRYCLRFCRPLR